MIMAGILRNRYNAESSVSLARSFWKDIISDIKLKMLPALEILLWGTYSKELSKGKVKKLTQRCLWLHYVWGEGRSKRMRGLDGIIDSVNLRNLQEIVKDRGHKESDTTEWLKTINSVWGKTKQPRWPKQKKNHHSLKKHRKCRKYWGRSKSK